jgi:DNA (cytosine-5)-methyltransferase 1
VTYQTPRTERSAYLGDGWDRTPMGLYLPPQPTKEDLYDRPVAVDLFCGAGGMGLGFHQAGFHVAAAMDHDESSAITYMTNLARPGVQIHFDTPESEAKLNRALEREWKAGGKKEWATMPVAGSAYISGEPPSVRGCEQFFFGDVRNFTGDQILDALGLERGEVDVVSGGPPCQGFSVAGRRNVHDPRNSLVFEFARLVVEIQPKAFVFENVPGIASMVTPDGVPVIDELCAYFETNGMGTIGSIKAALEGYPQSRVVRRERKVGKPDREMLETIDSDDRGQLAMAL